MRLRKLGQTDLAVSVIGLGCWQFSQGKGLFGNFWGTLADEEIREIVRISLEGGINWFDTAEAYGYGRSEKVLSQTLRSLNVGTDDVVIATKWQPTLKTANSLRRTIDKRLNCLARWSSPFPERRGLHTRKKMLAL